MDFKVPYRNKFFDLDEYFELRLPAHAKEEAWNAHKVTEKIFLPTEELNVTPNGSCQVQSAEFTLERQVEIIQGLEKAQMLNILKSLTLNKKYHECLNSGLLYHYVGGFKVWYNQSNIWQDRCEFLWSAIVL